MHGEPLHMSENGTTKVSLNRDNPITGKTDWQRLESMTNAEVLRAAESDPDAQPLAPQQLTGATGLITIGATDLNPATTP